MDHDFAIKTKAVERYLLNEMSEAERDAYEEHYFNCAVCAEEVKIATHVLRSARQFPQTEPTLASPPQMPGHLRRWLARLWFFCRSSFEKRHKR